jgi:hypothetical protein
VLSISGSLRDRSTITAVLRTPPRSPALERNPTSPSRFEALAASSSTGRSNRHCGMRRYLFMDEIGGSPGDEVFKPPDRDRSIQSRGCFSAC